MSKFKVGDVVRIISQDAKKGNPQSKSDVAVITDLKTEFGYDFRASNKSSSDIYLYKNEIELEWIYNSSLYKLLQEG